MHGHGRMAVQTIINARQYSFSIADDEPAEDLYHIRTAEDREPSQ